MRNLFINVVLCGMCLLLFRTESGYCLFRDDVDPQQMRSRVMIQREKDKQQLQQQNISQSTAVGKLNNNAAENAAATSVSGGKTTAVNAAGQSPMDSKPQEYKRLSRTVRPVTDSPVKRQIATATALKEEKQKKRSSGKLVLFVIIALIAFRFFKKRNQ